jgi:ribose/xylose/arabinose/galactoside ABC-type transport system permease subunit
MNAAAETLQERREFSVLVGLVAIWAIGLIIAPAEFLELNRFNRMFRSAAQTAVIGYGVALLMVTAEFDLSVGSLYALAGGMAVFMMSDVNIGSPLAALLILVFAFVYGISQGLMVTKLKLPSLIVTIGTLTMLRGALRVLTGGVTISGGQDDHIFNYFGAEIELSTLPIIGVDGPVPIMTSEGFEYMIPIIQSEPRVWNTFSVQIIWAVILLLVFHYILFYTRFGYHARSTGDNIDSVDTTGVDPELIKIGCFGIASVMAAFGSMMLLGRSLTVSSATGSGLELTVIAAVVLGGTKLTGGEGSMVGTALGALVFAAANSILNLAGFGLSGWQGVITGAFIVAAIGLDAVFRVVSLESVRSAYVAPTRELLTSPVTFFRVTTNRKTTDDMFAYIVTSVLVTGITFLVADAILNVNAVNSAIGIDTSDLMLFTQGGFIEALVQVYFFVMLLAILAFLAIQISLSAFGKPGDYENTLAVVCFGMAPAPLLTIPVLVYGYDLRIPSLGTPLVTGMLVLAPVLLSFLGLMYVGVTQTRDLSSGQGAITAAATGAVWALMLAVVWVMVVATY